MEQKKQKTAIFDSKIFWIVISLLSSLAIWIYVVSTENSVVTQIFRGVQVEIVGEEKSVSLVITCRKVYGRELDLCLVLCRAHGHAGRRRRPPESL